MILLVIKLTLVLCLTLAAIKWVGTSAASRHRFALIGLLSLPAIVLLEVWVPQVPVFTAPAVVVDLTPNIHAADAIVVAAELAGDDAWRLSSGWQFTYQQILIAIYLFGAGVFLAVWGMRIAQTRMFLARVSLGPVECESLGEFVSQQATLRAPSLVTISGSAGPFTWGVSNPTIYVPLAWQDWDKDKQRAVLAHECAHIDRRDVATSMIALLVCSLCWFHPLVWMLRRQMLLDAEIACDDEAVLQGIEVRQYAQTLLDITKDLRSQITSDVAEARMASQMASISNLSKRVHTLLDEKTRRTQMSSIQTFSAWITAICFTVAMSVMTTAAPLTPDPSVMSEQVYKLLNKTQEEIKAEKYDAVIRQLEAVIAASDIGGTPLSENDQGQIYNMVGYANFLSNDYAKAISAYEQVLMFVPSIPPGLHQTTLYTLAQLNFVQKKYEAAIGYMEQWLLTAQTPGPAPKVFIAQTLYELKRYEESLVSLDEGIAIARARDVEVRPNWLQLRSYLVGVTSGSQKSGEGVRHSPDADAMLIGKVQPVYPQRALNEGLEGFVDVAYTIDVSGKVIDAKAVDGSVEKVFDRAAVRAVSRYRYKPRVEAGEPVAHAAQVRVEFRLDD